MTSPRLGYVILELGLRCNLRCLHCAAEAGAPRRRELTFEDWARVVADLVEMEVPAVDLMGGEVLLSPLLPQVGALLQRSAIAWGLLSNGWLLDAERAGSLVELGCRGIGLSLDGATAATHDALRGRKGSFERVLRALDVVTSLDFKASNRAVITSVSAKNLGELPAIGALLGRRAPGIRWQLNLCSADVPRFPAALRLGPEGIAQVQGFIAGARRSGRFDLLVTAAHDLGYFIDEPSLRDYRWEGCPAGIHHAGIQSDGLVKGCLLLDESFGVGNVTERRLRALWEDAAAMSRYREVKVEELGEGCRECVWGAVCRGGCPAHSVAYTGKPHQHPHCLWRDASTKDRGRSRRPVVGSSQKPRRSARPRKTAWLTPLRSACIELTRRCNLHCLHCGSAAGTKLPRELDLGELEAVIRDIANLGGERIALLGGEPLLHRGWRRVVELARGQGLDVALITNGLPVTAEVARALVDSGLTHVGLSLDGASDKVHDPLRGMKGARTRVWEALERIRSVGLPITVITTAVRTNLPQLEQMRDQLVAAGPGLVWQIQAASSGGERFPADLAVHPEDLLRIARFIEETRKTVPLDTLAVAGAHDVGYYPATVRDFGTAGTWRGCPGGITSLGITSDGSLKPCLSMQDNEIQGNVRERPLRSLWRDPRRFERNRFPAPGKLEGECARCPYGSLCRGGCPQMARTGTGDVWDNPFCLRRVERAS